MGYLSANRYYKQRFGKKMYKASISLDVTCPNRDGTKGVGGCIFCSAGGSGEHASSSLDGAISAVAGKAGDDAGFIAYFQSFTSTYCDVNFLREEIQKAIAHPRVEAVAIGTRPDCLPDDMAAMLSDINKKVPVYIELGLQTASDDTAALINRCYKTAEFYDAVKRLRSEGIEVCAHVIFGLPGESIDDMMDTVKVVVSSGCTGIKFTCLYVLRGTRLEEMYENKEFEVLQMEEYFDIVDRALGILPEDMTVFRLTGDGPKSLLIAPEWTKNKRAVINYINRRFGNG